MLGYIIRRLCGAAALFFALTFATYTIFFVLPLRRTPGTRLLVENLNQRPLALSGSVIQQYGQFLGHVFGGSMGRSVVTHEDVTTIVANAAPVTISLVVGGAIIWLALAIPIGVFSALRPRSLTDRLATVGMLVGISAHPIWIGYVLSYFFGYRWHVTPIAGYCNLRGNQIGCAGPVQWAYHLLLPWLTFALLFGALYMRMIRASVLEALDQDYVRTARAKGAPELRVLRSHVLRNAFLPILTMMGMDIGVAFGGAVFVEAVFGLPGLGGVAVASLRVHDLPVITGIVVWTTLAIVGLNLLVDLLYAWIDPRIRFDSIEHAGRPATAGA
ncbi:MAG TPA: ABC transporter permease [Gaiellaceae bacterium]|nr:ABC transporter permease [Gaiellaceae bacterium]